jgi:CheY-like chemotaxis protein
MDKVSGMRVTEPDSLAGQVTREALILVIEDDFDLSDAFRCVCECLEVAVERIPSRDDLAAALHRHRPMAVVAAMDAAGQDGCHVLMTVAAQDRDLPVLLIAGDDPALLGAIDAVEEIWGLTSVIKWRRLLGVGAVVDFLFRAGRKGDCMRLMSV